MSMTAYTDSGETGRAQGGRQVSRPRPVRPRLRPDMATVLGLAGAVALLATAMILGGSPLSFVDGPAMLVVIGGTLMITTVSFSLRDMFATQADMFRVVLPARWDPQEIGTQLTHIADYARAYGLLALENVLPQLGRQPILQRGLQMVVDGVATEEAIRAMQQDIEAAGRRAEHSAVVLRRSAEIAPAMGLIGTLMGLVQMLGNLEDPSRIGHDMALALLTTFYGAILATMVFSPLAVKLERLGEDERLIHELYKLLVTSVGRQENPRHLEVMLNTMMPPGQPVRYFE